MEQGHNTSQHGCLRNEVVSGGSVPPNIARMRPEGSQ